MPDYGEACLYLGHAADDPALCVITVPLHPGTHSPTLGATGLRDGDAGLGLVTKIQPLRHSSVSLHHCTALENFSD